MNSRQCLNPFAARRIRPGVLPYLFGSGTLDNVIQEFQQARFRGQIVGPHGSGKSTLLLTIIGYLESHGQAVSMVRLPARQDGEFSRAQRELMATVRGMSQGILAIDGWDQLPFLSRIYLAWQVKTRGLGLLITTHRRARLPVLMQTEMTLATARQVVLQLLETSPLDDTCRQRTQAMITRELPGLLHAQQGNLREVLFALYDRFEQLPAAAAPEPSAPSEISPA